MAILRIALGVVVGAVIGFALVLLGDWINHRLWPPPPEVQVTNPEALRAYMRSAPFMSLLGLPVTWTIAAFASAFAGATIGGRRWVGWIPGALLCVGTAANLIMIPHPAWMLIAAIVFVPSAAWFGAQLGAKRIP